MLFKPLVDLKGVLSVNVLVVWKFWVYLSTGDANLNEVRISGDCLCVEFARIFTKDHTNLTRVRRPHDEL